VLDDDDRLYLQRYFDYERRLARRLMQLAAPPARSVIDDTLCERLAALFAANAQRLGERADWQKIAVALAMSRRLTVVSGGPGTGKTTTVVNLLACLLEENPECRIRLAAPTGKAAARMLDAIRARAAALPPGIAARLPAESFTIHRLLGVTPASDEFRHRADNRLPIDVLVVDEASMLDLALATRLFEAVPDTARVILLGDKDQLAAVESGAVFSELSVDPTLSAACVDDLAALSRTPVAAIRPPAPVQASALRDAAVWFTQNFRFARETVLSPNSPMPLSGLGLAYFVEAVVDHVEPNNPAAAAGVQPNDQVVAVQFKGPDDLRNALLARRDQFAQTFTENLMTFALGRGVKYYDMPRVREIVRESAKQNYRLSAIVLGIVGSDAFQMAEVPKAEDAPLSAAR